MNKTDPKIKRTLLEQIMVKKAMTTLNDRTMAEKERQLESGQGDGVVRVRIFYVQD